MQSARPLRTLPNLLRAWLVHIYTASGALAAFFGTLAMFDDRYRDAFLWMIVSTFVDATDGLLARAARVRQILPGFDGARLDDIVDYLTFVFLPVLLLYRAGTLPPAAHAKGVGDTLKIVILGHEDISGNHQIRPDGTIKIPFLGVMQAAGKSADQLSDEIAKGLNEALIVNPKVSVEIFGHLPFYILGQVQRPGSYEYQPGLNVRKAVALAGGFTPRAKTGEVKLIRGLDSKHSIEIDASPNDEVLPGDTVEILRRWF